MALPTPDPGRWSTQIIDTYRQLRDQYLGTQGISRATSSAAPDILDTLRINNEGMLAILLSARAV